MIDLKTIIGASVMGISMILIVSVLAKMFCKWVFK